MKKPKGYWNNYERCLDEVIKCKCKTELQKENGSAYNAIIRNNWQNVFEFYDSIKPNHYIEYDKKSHCVYVYEIFGEKTCYIGRTNNIKRRHRQHVNGIYSSTQKCKYFDVLNRFCNENNIAIPNYIILEKELTAKESLEREDFYVKKYRQDKWNVLNKGVTGKNGSLGMCIKWTYEKCRQESLKYKGKRDFMKHNKGAWNAAYKNGWLNDFYPTTLHKPKGYWQNVEHCKEAAELCRNLKEMSLKYSAAYLAVRKNKWQNLMVFNNNIDF